MVIDVGPLAQAGHHKGFLLTGSFSVVWLLIACAVSAIGSSERNSKQLSDSWEAMQLQAKHHPLCSLLYQTPACAAIIHRKSAKVSRPGPACGVETCPISNAHAPSFTAPSMPAARHRVKTRAQVATGIAIGISLLQHDGEQVLSVLWTFISTRCLELLLAYNLYRWQGCSARKTQLLLLCAAMSMRPGSCLACQVITVCHCASFRVRFGVTLLSHVKRPLS